jgi:hypothetical protein
VANYKRRVDQLILRFENQLKRHDDLIELWQATSNRADKAEEVIELQSKQLELKDNIIKTKDEQIESIIKLTDDEKRQSWRNGFTVGGVTGVLICTVLFIVASN